MPLEMAYLNNLAVDDFDAVAESAGLGLPARTAPRESARATFGLIARTSAPVVPRRYAGLAGPRHPSRVVTCAQLANSRDRMVMSAACFGPKLRHSRRTILAPSILND